ncbi:ATPase, AAA family protein [Reticulomyxa filosa]|uniref:ATPase, AAA family protein n=1 Tax=Reticulomyxa filosa TaxID=46433 RepID=X6MCB5_RETFI|nr:ATPase, AAA family protein [Reticulomyxa filosa]|eukprot:ETO11301.1 ATPase, AAA family protein [Reticulomyxa filosa]
MLQCKRLLITHNTLYPKCTSWHYINLDQIAFNQFRLHPYQLELQCAKFFLEEDTIPVDRLELLQNVFNEHKATEKTSKQEKSFLNVQPPSLTISEALELIIKMERGRQGVMSANIQKVTFFFVVNLLFFSDFSTRKLE